MKGIPTQYVDSDPEESQEWIESLDATIDAAGPTRARHLVRELLRRASERNLGISDLRQTDYINTIHPEDEPEFPGDEEIEHRIRAYCRWNAAIMVHRAQRPGVAVGGHISSYASSASLYEVGFNHFFNGPGVDGGDQIRDVLVDDDGTIVVAGWKNNTTTGNDAWVARYSAEGAEIWSTLIGGGVAGDDRLFGVAAGAQGELVLCGQIDVGGQLDAWVATYSNNGAEKWARTFNSAGTDKDVAYACAANQVGTVFTGVTATTATGSDFWLVVHNALGDPTVSQLHGEPDLDEFARAVAVDKDGNLVIVGADSAVGTGTNLMIRKYRSTTDLLWKHSLAGPGTSNDHGYGVATDGLGNVIVAGTQAVGIADDLELWLGKLTP